MEKFEETKNLIDHCQLRIQQQKQRLKELEELQKKCASDIAQAKTLIEQEKQNVKNINKLSICQVNLSDLCEKIAEIVGEGQHASSQVQFVSSQSEYANCPYKFEVKIAVEPANKKYEFATAIDDTIIQQNNPDLWELLSKPITEAPYHYTKCLSKKYLENLVINLPMGVINQYPIVKQAADALDKENKIK